MFRHIFEIRSYSLKIIKRCFLLESSDNFAIKEKRLQSRPTKLFRLQTSDLPLVSTRKIENVKKIIRIRRIEKLEIQTSNFI